MNKEEIKEFKEKNKILSAYSFIRDTLIRDIDFVENNNKISNLQKEIEKKVLEELLTYFDETILKRVEL